MQRRADPSAPSYEYGMASCAHACGESARQDHLVAVKTTKRLPMVPLSPPPHCWAGSHLWLSAIRRAPPQ
jgi:hypothetical protein